ncbi:MAG: hypothetical protein GYB65_08695 [Chloroflexi bacterium]|nr:hypothetical protein [Chloroflexota bacterium]
MNATENHFVSLEAFAEYENSINWFYSELVRLNTTVYILEQIFDFPLDLFGFHYSPFFRMLIDNFMQTAVLIITRLTTDHGNKHTFDRFKNRLGSLLKPEYHKQLKPHQESAKHILESIKQKLKSLRNFRNAYVAHLAEDFVSGKTSIKRFDLTDLQQIRDALNQLLHILSLKENHAYMMVPVDYSSEVVHPKGSQSDIERIFDSIARNSVILNMPEDNPSMWFFKKQRLTAETIAVLNSYRRKFGLPEMAD